MTTTMAEPEWDTETRELVLAYAKVDLCPRCGRPSFICQDPDLQFNWRVPPPVRCHATTALIQAQARVDEKSNPQSGALMWHTELVLADDREGGTG